jgi:hypothetical protein
VVDTAEYVSNSWTPTTPGSQLPAARPQLPDLLHLTTMDAQRVPSPGTQRALKAQLGKDFGELMGADADAADRFQTIIWMTLRKTIPGLRWEECEDVELVIDDGPATVDPTTLGGSAALPPSAGSGV